MNNQGNSNSTERVRQCDTGQDEGLPIEDLGRPRLRVALLTVRRTLAGAQTKAYLGTSSSKQ